MNEIPRNRHTAVTWTNTVDTKWEILLHQAFYAAVTLGAKCWISCLSVFLLQEELKKQKAAEKLKRKNYEIESLKKVKCFMISPIFEWCSHAFFSPRETTLWLSDLVIMFCLNQFQELMSADRELNETAVKLQLLESSRVSQKHFTRSRVHHMERFF